MSRLLILPAPPVENHLTLSNQSRLLAGRAARRYSRGIRFPTHRGDAHVSDTNSLKDLEPTKDEARPDAAPTLPAVTLPATDACGAEVLERLGVGGMGEVYRCGDDALGRDLAVKILKAELRGNAAAEKRFLREARLTGSLQHPGIVPVHYF